MKLLFCKCVQLLLATRCAFFTNECSPDKAERDVAFLRHRPAPVFVVVCSSLTTSNMSLDTLPLELLFRVLDFISNPREPSSCQQHPLNSLAATSKHLDSAVEEYTRALLKQYANFAPQKKSKAYTSRRKWLAETCQLCYKKSKRHSTLWANLTCCLACDKKHFPKVVGLKI